MALTDVDLSGLEVEAEARPEKGSKVEVSEIPAALVKRLETEAPRALKDKNYEVVLRLPYDPKETDDEKATSLAHVSGVIRQLTLYAAAWGKGQTPKLYIHKRPNRKGVEGNVARLAVEDWEKVPAENRPGRRG